ncbi:uncharacterized protein LOC135309856 [Plodia interpunctella]|uniref:uncharacterized protein LOC135309856 n=1 Tax=Plodia interpunctella TaxID=58824 RepID=UPI0031015566
MDASERQISLINENLAKLSLRMDDSDRRVEKLEARLQVLERQVAEKSEQNSHELIRSVENLKMELNDRDQDILLNDIEISSVPELKGENLPHIVMTLANKLGVSLAAQDVMNVSRLGPSLETAAALSGSEVEPRRPRLILVRLARKAVRDELLQAARVRRGITTADTGLPTRRFYVNERLTKLNRHLFRRTREATKQHNWRFAWTREGKIFVRQHHEPNSPRIRIRTDKDLIRVFGPEAVGSEKLA